ncbi:transposase [candidate division KSB1 bacterium]
MEHETGTWYNRSRYHESLNNFTPEDIYHGREKKIISMREMVRRKTMKLRREYHLRVNAK